MSKKRRRWLWLLIALLIAIGLLWRHSLTGPTVEQGSFLLVPLDGSYVEEPPSDFLAHLFGRPPRTLIDLLGALHVASVDSRIAGAILQIRSLDVGWAKAQDIRESLAAFEAAGKPVYAVLEQEGMVSNKEYFVGSVANRLYATPAAIAPVVGLAGQSFFLGGVWDKVDIQMHVEKIGHYKTAGDMLENKEMSPYQREMDNSILDSVNREFLATIAKARHLQPSEVQHRIDQGPSTAEELEKAGLSDGAKYVADVRHDDAKDAPVVKMEDYQNVDPGSVGISTSGTIAVVYAVGPIVLGEGGRSLLQGPMMGSNTIVKGLQDAADNDDAKAIVFRIDSPGGSALASDLIWKETQEARKKKPVIVSMSDVAGSGGYYIAAGADKILAQETTLTGSIGVLFARPTITALLSRMGITSETLTRGKYARIDDLTAPYDDALRKRMVEQMDTIYQEFISRVARGRNLTVERVNQIGQGRVWTGQQAVDNGLVDQIGGFSAAISAAKDAAGIPEKQEVELVYYPKHKTFAERLIESLTTRMAGSGAVWLDDWRAALPVFPFTQKGVLTVMREQMEIR